MIVLAGLKDHIGRLVHPSALGSSIEAARHRLFIATRISLSCLALALVPVFLATGGVPKWLDAILLAWMVLPLVAAAQVSNTGRLASGEALSAASWIGLAVTAALGHACGLGAACVVLVAVPIEALLMAAPWVATCAVAAAFSALTVLLCHAGLVGSAAPAFGRGDAVLIVFAAIHIASLVLCGRAIQRTRDDLARLDAQRYRVLSEAIGDLVLRFDRAGFVLAAGGASERSFGIPSRDLMGRGFFDRVHVGDRPAFLQAVSQAANGSDNITINLRFRIQALTAPNGDYAEPVFAWVEVRTRPFEDGNPLPSGPGDTAVVAAVRDITVRVQHEAEIERAKRDAEQANASKDRFIATVSHELRTPLNAIIGFAEMLASPTLSPQDPEKRREYAEIIGTSGQHLLAVVNSLLDLSKLDAGKFELCCEPFDIAELIHACCDMVGLKAEQNGILLRHDAENGLEPVIGDKRACKQIILNLLSNALKFTPAGGRVAVSARPDGNAVLVSVVDTGIGMVPRDLAKLGDPFFQVRGDYDRPYEGTGLGLSVVKGLVGLHGGSITVESAPGEGTRIAVRLPIDGRRAQPQRPPSAKIEVITRYPRSASAAPGLEPQKVQKIA
ncbi:PAS domain-containing sensor histidine kinase [Lichenifustis flavocetrariae]|uniref:histidine kinase n=1 Tax=Lichenifustis flavocetrariae TaxID=2949735 RepID=A0AA42CHQ9_9HYPH|nr:PAS domain-containing sensor histidine kinase [Lichenifustis flavocetrariae]MCW6507519.1 PAS domain-containing sensor histidine kinase [Lichenifustis flavocetrariae]